MAPDGTRDETGLFILHILLFERDLETACISFIFKAQEKTYLIYLHDIARIIFDRNEEDRRKTDYSRFPEVINSMGVEKTRHISQPAQNKTSSHPFFDLYKTITRR
jgi:hypothetical protein